MVKIYNKYKELEQKQQSEEFYLLMNHRESTRWMVAQFRLVVRLMSPDDLPGSLFDGIFHSLFD